MRRRVGQGVIFAALLFMTITIPLMIEAIFPGGRGGSSSDLPLELPVQSAPSSSASNERIRTSENVAWLRGDGGSILDAGAESAVESDEEEEAEAVELDQAVAGLPLDLRPGVFAGYTRSWDNLEIRREQIALGAFVFLSSHTRLQASGARLFFRDDTDKISGNALRLDGAHRLPSGWLLEEGLERDDYDGLHDSWNGDARLSGPITSRLALTLEGGRSDMWERLNNIRDRLRLWQAGLGLYYQLLPRWWLAGYGNGGWLSDHNGRSSLGGEAGHVISPRLGFSASAGAEVTSFRDQEATYWSPSYYHYIYGRLRLTRNFERAPFERLPGNPMTRAERWGYLAEFTGGVNDDGRYEQGLRGGLRWRATRSLSFHAEFFHLDSNGRFDETYSENRLDTGVEVRF